ncbi:hypothetical protein JNJ66_01080 [Candidatus Saccharibacteria bacterium]|nr:hypothetical protein [Candidatus Saccharibacteria bacterium]
MIIMDRKGRYNWWLGQPHTSELKLALAGEMRRRYRVRPWLVAALAAIATCLVLQLDAVGTTLLVPLLPDASRPILLTLILVYLVLPSLLVGMLAYFLMRWLVRRERRRLAPLVSELDVRMRRLGRAGLLNMLAGLGKEPVAKRLIDTYLRLTAHLAIQIAQAEQPADDEQRGQGPSLSLLVDELDQYVRLLCDLLPIHLDRKSAVEEELVTPDEAEERYRADLRAARLLK